MFIDFSLWKLKVFLQGFEHSCLSASGQDLSPGQNILDCTPCQTFSLSSNSWSEWSLSSSCRYVKISLTRNKPLHLNVWFGARRALFFLWDWYAMLIQNHLEARGKDKAGKLPWEKTGKDTVCLMRKSWFYTMGDGEPLKVFALKSHFPCAPPAVLFKSPCFYIEFVGLKLGTQLK